MKKGLTFFLVALIFFLFAYLIVVPSMKQATACIGQLTTNTASIEDEIKTKHIEKIEYCLKDKALLYTYKSCLKDVQQNTFINPIIFYKLSGQSETEPSSLIYQHNKFCNSYAGSLIDD